MLVIVMVGFGMLVLIAMVIVLLGVVLWGLRVVMGVVVVR